MATVEKVVETSNAMAGGETLQRQAGDEGKLEDNQSNF